MKRADRDLWCHELRTTAKKQGREWLRHDDIGWCCLAIGADVLLDDAWVQEPGGNWWSIDGRAGFPTDERLKTMGLPLDHALHLAQMNDDGVRFPEIADWIEANVPVED